MYQFLTTQSERKKYRTRVQRILAERREEFLNKKANQELQQRLSLTGYKFFNVIHVQITRLLVSLFIFVYYILFPFINEQFISWNAIFFLFLFIVSTEPKIKYSLLNISINALIKRNERAKIVELFTLFDILKADLNTLKDHQEINVYNIIKNILPLFEHIKGPLSKFLSLWKRSPKLAKETFHSEIGGEHAKILSDILFRLDNVTKKEALELINAESSVFSTQYYQKVLQRTNRSKTIYLSLFMATNIMSIVWLIVFLFNMFNDRLSETNILF